MSELEDPINEEQVKAAINDLPSDKAPGPDGFTDLFFKKCWQKVKGDVMRVIRLFEDLHGTNLHWLISANVVLLLKMGAEGISDYRPISQRSLQKSLQTGCVIT